MVSNSPVVPHVGHVLLRSGSTAVGVEVQLGPISGGCVFAVILQFLCTLVLKQIRDDSSFTLLVLNISSTYEMMHELLRH